MTFHLLELCEYDSVKEFSSHCIVRKCATERFLRFIPWSVYILPANTLCDNCFGLRLVFVTMEKFCSSGD